MLVPEIWINVAKKTGIEELKLTTRDISDYDVLMKKRLSILKKNNLRLKDIRDVIAGMDPLTGALDFLNWLRARTQVVVVSDTFVQFAGPLMEKLGYPTLFCNSLEIGEDDSVTGYKLRQKDGKRKTVQALKTLNYKIIAMGDSYNDITMIEEADKGVLFCPPANVVEDYPDLPVAESYGQIKKILENTFAEL